MSIGGPQGEMNKGGPKGKLGGNRETSIGGTTRETMGTRKDKDRETREKLGNLGMKDQG